MVGKRGAHVGPETPRLGVAWMGSLTCRPAHRADNVGVGGLKKGKRADAPPRSYTVKRQEPKVRSSHARVRLAVSLAGSAQE